MRGGNSPCSQQTKRIVLFVLIFLLPIGLFQIIDNPEWVEAIWGEDYD